MSRRQYNYHLRTLCHFPYRLREAETENHLHGLAIAFEPGRGCLESTVWQLQERDMLPMSKDSTATYSVKIVCQVTM